MKPRVFLLKFDDGTRRRVTCVLDPDRHTSTFIREYLAEIALHRRVFHEPSPELIGLEEEFETSQPQTGAMGQGAVS